MKSTCVSTSQRMRRTTAVVSGALRGGERGIVFVGEQHRRGDVDRQPGALDTASPPIVRERGADGEPELVDQPQRPRPTAAAAARPADDEDVVETLEAEQEVFARR